MSTNTFTESRCSAAGFNNGVCDKAALDLDDTQRVRVYALYSTLLNNRNELTSMLME